MGKPNVRLNPQIRSELYRTLYKKATNLLLGVALLLPVALSDRRGPKPYDYRRLLVLCVLRVLLRKTYEDYETEMRTDPRLKQWLKMNHLPSKSTLHRFAQKASLAFLARFNQRLISPWIKKPIDFVLDASGIRIVGKSVWFCIKTRKKVLKKDCDKVHLAVSHSDLLIANFRITSSKRNDSPFLRKLLKPFKALGLVIVDKGYSNKTNANFVTKKGGAFFCPFKKNANPSGLTVWNRLYRLWQAFPSLCETVYNRRNRVEAVFSALKRRYGDSLHGKKWYMRRREMALRLIAYNVKIVLAIQIARTKRVPLWVKA